MTVSLADEVSLESTAPNPVDESQAAVAPVLSPEPAPAPEVRQVARELPRPTPRQTTTPRPTPRETPRPTQTQRAGGTRMGDDFLEGAGSSERSNQRAAPAVTFGATEAAALNQAIARELRPHWSAPQGVDAEKLITIVRFRLNPDGSLNGNPSCIRQSGETPSNSAQKGLHCERAIRAVRLAAPFDLPDQFYDKWKLVDSTFDRRL
jgi:hypothetical protein